jgi:hypothetical protein
MKVIINDTTIEIFNGARVKDALLKYSKAEYRAVLKNKGNVTDKHKNPLDLDGELSENQQLYIENVTTKPRMKGRVK